MFLDQWCLNLYLSSSKQLPCPLNCFPAKQSWICLRKTRQRPIPLLSNPKTIPPSRFLQGTTGRHRNTTTPHLTETLETCDRPHSHPYSCPQLPLPQLRPTGGLQANLSPCKQAAARRSWWGPPHGSVSSPLRLALLGELCAVSVTRASPRLFHGPVPGLRTSSFFLLSVDVDHSHMRKRFCILHAGSGVVLLHAVQTAFICVTSWKVLLVLVRYVAISENSPCTNLVALGHQVSKTGSLRNKSLSPWPLSTVH